MDDKNECVFVSKDPWVMLVCMGEWVRTHNASMERRVVPNDEVPRKKQKGDRYSGLHGAPVQGNEQLKSPPPARFSLPSDLTVFRDRKYPWYYFPHSVRRLVHSAGEVLKGGLFTRTRLQNCFTQTYTCASWYTRDVFDLCFRWTRQVGWLPGRRIAIIQHLVWTALRPKNYQTNSQLYVTSAVIYFISVDKVDSASILARKGDSGP